MILWAEGQRARRPEPPRGRLPGAWFSQGREGKVPVDSPGEICEETRRGPAWGMVIYTTYQTAYVDP